MSNESIEPISVLIVDDHAVVRRGVRGYLEAQSDLAIAGEAASGEEAVRLAADHTPDVILMDLVLDPSTGSGHGMDGVEATRRVLEVSPGSRVIVLTSYHDDAHIFPDSHHLLEESSGFVSRKAQIVLPDFKHLSPGPQAGDGQGRVLPRQNDQVNLGREMVQQKGQLVVNGWGVDDVIVVEGQDDGDRNGGDVVDQCRQGDLGLGWLGRLECGQGGLANAFIHPLQRGNQVG